jgi:PBSX family phage portal protein
MAKNEEGTVKAQVIDGSGRLASLAGRAPLPRSNAAASTAEDDAKVFDRYGAIPPLYDPVWMAELFTRSSALRPNVDAYCTNIEGYGYRLEPTLDVADADKLREQLKLALLRDKVFEQDPTPDVPDAEVGGELLTLHARMQAEKFRIEQFWEQCGSELPFSELRARARMDLEVTGNAFLEVVRRANGSPAQLVHLNSVSMRLLRCEAEFQEVEERVRTSAVTIRKATQLRRFRKFVQVMYGQFVAFFKELGDPRVMSSATGKYYATLSNLRRYEPRAAPATEVLHFKIHSPVTVYGVPRWVGAMLSVMGSRKSEEVNIDYFDNKAIPPLAILVSGGKLAGGATDRIANYVEEHIKGQKNFHKILVLEAEAGAGSRAMTGGPSASRVQIEIKPLMDAQLQDALFQQYDANNAEKIGNQFRLPKILRGDMKDFNRATADAALEYAESQVFQPERDRFDAVINKRIMVELLGARFWSFVSNSHSVNDAPQLSEMLGRDVEKGVLSINEGREIAAQVYSREFKPYEQEWAKRPLPITLEEMKSASGQAAGQTAELQLAANLSRVREAMVAQETAKEMRELHFARLSESGGAAIELPVQQAVWDTWFETQG